MQRFLAGETKIALAQEFALSSPQLIARWLRVYRAERRGGVAAETDRPSTPIRAPASGAREVERLQRENERLRAEVAYLGKLQALRAPTRP